jgi:predicted TIM-barrel fold metal-dependent hydrolase
MDNKGGGGKISKYFKDNFLVTTSGLFSDPPLICAIQQVGVDNVLFAVDYPFERSTEGTKWMAAAPLTESDKEKVLHLNAERVFKI